MLELQQNWARGLQLSQTKEKSTSRLNHKPASTKMVSSAETTTLSPEILDDPLQYLLPDSEDTSDVR